MNIDDQDQTLNAASDDVPVMEIDTVTTTTSQVVQEPVAESDVEIEFDDVIRDTLKDAKPSSAVLLEGDPIDRLTELLTAVFLRLGKLDFTRDAATPDTHTNILARQLNEISDEGLRVSESLSTLADPSTLASKHTSAHGNISLRIPVTNTVAEGPVFGHEGLIEFSRRRGKHTSRRVPLLNSGFFLDLESSVNAELHKFFTRVAEDVNAYGKEFGANFYLYSDLLIKKAFVDLFMVSVVGSNLHMWSKPGVLLENISINDFKAIILILAHLMYPEGYDDFTHACTNPAKDESGGLVCTHVSKAKIDVHQLLKHDFTKMNDKAIAHMCRKGGTSITKEELAEYRKELNFTKTITFKNWRITLAVPSLQKYLDYGDLFNSELVNDVLADNNNGMYQALGFRYYRTFTPWLVDIALLAEDGSVLVTTPDQSIIPALMDKVQSEDPEQEVLKQFHDYIASTELSYVVYPVAACPACGYVPETKTGYFTVDPAHTFFTLLLRKFRED